MRYDRVGPAPKHYLLLPTGGMPSPMNFAASPFSVEVTGSRGVPLQECSSSTVWQLHSAGIREFQMWGGWSQVIHFLGRSLIRWLSSYHHMISVTLRKLIGSEKGVILEHENPQEVGQARRRALIWERRPANLTGVCRWGLTAAKAEDRPCFLEKK